MNAANPWHILSEEEILEQLDSRLSGLSQEEVSERIRKYGRNSLPKRKRISALSVFLHQFLSPLIYVLLVAAVVSLVLDELSDAVFICLILLINAVIGASQEWKAEMKAEALQNLIRINVKTRRDGRTMLVDSEELVPGDVVLLESGNKVPADIRLMEENNVTVEEAILTGESMAVRKQVAPLTDRMLAIADRNNMLFAGTTISTGRATGLVVSTGLDTEIGMIASSLKELRMGKAPLVERMEIFARKISLLVLGACLVLGTIGYLNGIEIRDIFFFVVAVAVSAIPEGLPIAMTVALSIGSSRMAKRNVIIRKLTAVEALGSCTFIATDKTGTLTMDQQTVREIVLPGEVFKVSGEGYSGYGKVIDSQGKTVVPRCDTLLDLLVSSVVICNEGTLKQDDATGEWEHTGDPIDVALLALAFRYGPSPEEITSQIKRVQHIPFEPEKRFAVSYYRKEDRLLAAVKGAIESIGIVDDNAELRASAQWYAANGYRVIAVAAGEVAEQNISESAPPVPLLGFVALIDPLRPETADAIHACRDAGVKVAMITGDHPATALAIARQVGIANSDDELINGVELEQIMREGEEQLKEVLGKKSVFSRVSPAQKQRIVQTLRDSGHYIAVTGDGVNDAPALKTANIGVAMGYGTDVAKDTASLIITDNNFASIVAGIEEGRYTYSNLRKIIYLLISTGAAEIGMIALSLLFQLPLPFLPLQLLWLNLVTNGIQDVALAFESGEKKLMRGPPRRADEKVFDPLMIKQTVVSAVTISLLTFALWFHLLTNLHYDEGEARNIILLLMVLLQNFHVFNCRSETQSAFVVPVRANVVLMFGVFAAQVIHVLAMHIPVTQDLLTLQPVSLVDWLKLFFTASLVILVMEVFKLWRRRRLDARK